jgi:hypothetical protein
MAELSIGDEVRRGGIDRIRLRLVPPNDQPTTSGNDGGWLWYCLLLLLLLSGPAVLVLVVFDAPSWVRAVPVFAYIAVVPGLAWIRLLRLTDRFTEILLGIGLSLAIGVLVAQLMIYLHAWTSTLGLSMLVAIASLPVLVDLYLGPRPDRSTARSDSGDAS